MEEDGRVANDVQVTGDSVVPVVSVAVTSPTLHGGRRVGAVQSNQEVEFTVPAWRVRVLLLLPLRNLERFPP